MFFLPLIQLTPHIYTHRVGSVSEFATFSCNVITSNPAAANGERAPTFMKELVKAAAIGRDWKIAMHFAEEYLL